MRDAIVVRAAVCVPAVDDGRDLDDGWRTLAKFGAETGGPVESNPGVQVRQS